MRPQYGENEQLLSAPTVTRRVVIVASAPLAHRFRPKSVPKPAAATPFSERSQKNEPSINEMRTLSDERL
jgi:hypothetical protein